MLFANNVLGVSGIEYLKSSGLFDSASITSTGLILQINGRLWLAHNGKYDASRLLESNEVTTLTPNHEFCFSTGRHARMVFTPVSFESQQKGFQVVYLVDNRRGEDVAEYKGYVALDDIPVEVGEDDVEMIMENGEWVPYMKSPPASETSEPPANNTPGDSPIVITSKKRDASPGIAPEVAQSPPEPEPLSCDTATPVYAWAYWAVGGALAVLVPCAFLLRKKP